MNKSFHSRQALVRSVAFGGAFLLGAATIFPVQAAPAKPGQKTSQKTITLSEVPNPYGKYTWTEADNGKSKTIKVGETIKVRLKSNITTGYTWWVLAPTSPAAAHVVMGIGSPKYIAPATKGGVPTPGAGGIQEMLYTAQKKGKTQIKMEYKRPWEKKKKPAQTFTVNVTVK